MKMKTNNKIAEHKNMFFSNISSVDNLMRLRKQKDKGKTKLETLEIRVSPSHYKDNEGLVSTLLYL